MTHVLLYDFAPAVKRTLIEQAEDRALERLLELPGPTILTVQQAAYLMDRVRTADPQLAREIANHPGLKG